MQKDHRPRSVADGAEALRHGVLGGVLAHDGGMAWKTGSETRGDRISALGRQLGRHQHQPQTNRQNGEF